MSRKALSYLIRPQEVSGSESKAESSMRWIRLRGSLHALQPVLKLMTELLQQVISEIQKLPADQQDAIASRLMNGVKIRTITVCNLSV